MSTDPSLWLTALRRSHDRLAQAVTPLDAASIRALSYSAPWSIAEVLSHLGSQAEIFGLLFDAGLRGGDPPAPDSFPPIWDAWNARSPEDQVTDSLAANGDLLARIEALDAAQRDAFGLAAFGMDIDFPMFLRLRLSEQAVHTWDVVVALDGSATVAPDAVALLSDALPDLAARVGKPTEAPYTVRVVTADTDRELALVTDGVRLEPWSERAADGVLRLSSEELLRLVYGRLDPAHAPSAELESAVLSLDDLRVVFPGI